MANYNDDEWVAPGHAQFFDADASGLFTPGKPDIVVLLIRDDDEEARAYLPRADVVSLRDWLTRCLARMT